jgi:hypothetical protein
MVLHLLRLNISLLISLLKGITTETVLIMKSIKEIIDLSTGKNKGVKDFENVILKPDYDLKKRKASKSESKNNSEWFQLILDFGTKRAKGSSEWENKLRTEE